jgi:hypothetical protein
LSKTKKISFPNVKILKKNEKKHSHAYISKKKKKEIKKTSIAPAAVISQKKLSLKLYMCKLFLKGNLPKVVENQYLLDVLLPIISQKRK